MLIGFAVTSFMSQTYHIVPRAAHCVCCGSVQELNTLVDATPVYFFT